MTVEIRNIRPGDGAACAAIALEAARYYAEMDPRRYTVLDDDDGLADFFESLCAAPIPADPDRIRLIAETSGDVVGYLAASLLRPGPNARHTFVRRLRETTLSIDSLMVAERARRGGVATALMDAAHEWGTSHGAVLSMLDTYVDSPLSVPFYERRMGYARSAIIFDRALEAG